MTAELLDRLLYTDCRPGTGRGAGGGFQVQAQSSGVDSMQSKLAVGWLLYEVQLPWLTQRRPVEDFPLGFAHASGEGYGTAQSRYLGKVATGGRDGNHLADCLLTRDPDLYGPVRPAQLWRSGLWRAEPWDGKDCPRFDAADLEPGPLTVDAVAEWARAASERGPVLARLLSVLENPDGKRVVILADDPEQAMTWIAAATLLLPTRRALGVSFKVFSSAPLDAQHRVVAAPAALFPRIAPGLTGQRFVLDARTCTADEAETSERATFFVGRVTSGDDPYDVVDAVELADALSGGEGADDRNPSEVERLGNGDALLTAWALTRPADPRPEPAALLRWLSGTGPELFREHGPAVVAMVLESAPPARALRWIDRAVADKRLDFDAATVRVQLLDAELAEIHGGQSPPADTLPLVSLDPGADRDAVSKLSSAILLGSNQQVDLLLRLARRHEIELDLALPLQQRLRDFVSGWIDRPGAYHPDGWALRARVLDCAHDELRDRIAADGVGSIADAIRKLNRFFGDRADLNDPLDCHIQGSLIAGAGHAESRQRLRQLLAAVAQLALSPAPAEARDAATGLQRALIKWDAVDGDVAVTVLIDLPDSLEVEPAISQRALEQLTTMSAKPTRELLDLLASLDKQGKAPSSGALGHLLEADRDVRTFTRRALENKLTERKHFNDTVTLLRKTDSAVVEARIDDVLSACVQARHPDLGPVVLASLKSPLPRLLVQRWGDTLGRRDLVGDGLWCVRCLDHEDLPERRQDQLAAAVRNYGERLAKRDLESWRDEVARRLRSGERPVWESVFAEEAPRSRINLWISRGGGRS
jgi:GTPase-associated protein 1, N-terminal domain type 2/GTPase-associated protein 1, middle domain